MREQDMECAKKYDTEIRKIAIANNCDMMVGEAMFIYEIRVNAGIIKRMDIYNGLEGYDFTEAIADYKELIK